jgi:aspartyl-tRNA(Asn)/glutamyl-tRNA(Gln) amidotransferase subunit C
MRGVSISREDVLHVADLARLALTPEEVERLGEQLGAILEAVGKVSELDLSGVEPMSHPLDLVNVWDEDEPRPSLPLEDALANAPEREESYFRVPPTAGVADVEP